MDSDITLMLRKIQQAQVPRAVKFNPASLSDIYFWLILLSCIVPLVIMRQAIFRAAAENFGKETEAEVISSRTWESTSKGHTYTHYSATVAFPLPEKKYSAKAPVSKDLYSMIKQGYRVNIKYIPGFEQYPYIDSGNSSTVYIIMIFFAVYLGSILWGLLVKLYLLKSGLPVIGVVTGTRIGGRGVVYWKVEYTIDNKPIAKEFRRRKNNPPEKVIVLIDPKWTWLAQIYEDKYPWKPAEE